MKIKYRLFLIRVFTLDWDAALSFYRDTLGFEVVFADPEAGWAQFNLGNAEIGLERCSPEDADAEGLVGRFVGCSIEVDDLMSVYAALRERGVEFVEPPEKQPWGGTLAHFRDPDGNVLTLLGS